MNAKNKSRPSGSSLLLRNTLWCAAAIAAWLVAGCASSSRCGQGGCCACATSCTAQEAAQTKSHFATYGTNKVHYVVEGKGPHTVVLIHCWSGNLGFWREQIPALAGKARLILMDLPGHGQSDKPETAYTMDFLAGGVLAVMRDAQVDKATLIGHSMGVPVSCRVYKQAPGRVAGIVAVDGLLRRPDIPLDKAAGFVDQFRGPAYRENTRQFIGTMFPVPGTEAVRDRVVSELLNTPQYVMLGAMEGLFGPSQPDWNIHHANIPVLALNAPNPMWTEEYINYVRSLSPQTDYRVIEGTGHWLMLEKPAEFNAVLTDMLQKAGLIGK